MGIACAGREGGLARSASPRWGIIASIRNPRRTNIVM